MLSKSSIALGGEFAVLSQLILRGYDANLTLGHSKNVDILVSNPQNSKMYKLEVKTRYIKRPKATHNSKIHGCILSSWIMNKKHEEVSEPNLFYCFVNIEGENLIANKFYIIPSKVVAKYVKDEHKLWLYKRNNMGQAVKDNLIREFRIGMRGAKYDIDTPYADDYENKWSFDEWA